MKLICVLLFVITTTVYIFNVPFTHSDSKFYIGLLCIDFAVSRPRTINWFRSFF